MLYSSPNEYLYQLKESSKAEAVRLWRKSIKEAWNECCAYCGENTENMTIDHIIPQALGGTDELLNVLCCCEDCNRDKGHTEVEIWYFQQYFFTQERWDKIEEWRTPKKTTQTKRYVRGKSGIPSKSILQKPKAL